MKKINIFLIIMALLVPGVLADIPLCEDTVGISENCTMMTPVLDSCTNYSYMILYAENGSIVVNNSLTSLSQDIYKFNLTPNIGEGEYQVKLCDGTTRQVRVTFSGGDDMAMGFIILLPMLLGIIFLVGSVALKDGHVVLKIFLFLMSLFTFFTSFHMGLLYVIKVYGWTDMQNTIGSATYYFMLIISVIITYFILHFLIVVLKGMMDRKKERIEF